MSYQWWSHSVDDTVRYRTDLGRPCCIGNSSSHKLKSHTGGVNLRTPYTPNNQALMFEGSQFVKASKRKVVINSETKLIKKY